MTDDSFDTSSLPDALGPILESFLARLRRGERPSIKEYADRHPDHAADILELFPPLAEMEQAGLVGESLSQSAARAGDSSRAGAAGVSGSRAADEASAPILERLGDYKILRRIDGGGMGIVYEAEREALRSRVALKVMHPRLRKRSGYLQLLLAEARVAASLHHTNIVTVFDYGEHDGVCYYAMRYIAGHSLDKVLADVKRLKSDATPAVAGKQVRNGAASQKETAPAEPTPGNAPPQDASLRSVSIGLLRGVFDSAPLASTGRQAAAPDPLQNEVAATQPQATRETRTDAGFSRSAAAEDVGSPAPSSSLSGISGSSWRAGSSLRYQREIARIGAQVADALEYAHKRKLIHRDIKPHNILLDALGNAWITDFGLAGLKQDEDQSTSHAVGGTLGYMAPERFQGKSDGRDDIYAVGASLYELLALRPVFDGADRRELVRQIEHEQPVLLRQVDRRIHPDLSAIIAATLAKDPADRYATAGELRDDLRRFMDGRPVKRRPVPAYSRFAKWCKREPWLTGANICAAVLTTVLAIGSTIAAKVYYDKSNQIAEQARSLKQSEIDVREKLFEAQVERARAGRFSRQVGQRFDSLDALERAAKIGRELGLPPERFDRIRDEAIACMALPDMKPTGRPIASPEDARSIAFDRTMARYAVRFRDGTIEVRNAADDRVINRFQARADREFGVFRLSPDGHYLAAGNVPPPSLTVWDVDRGRVIVDDAGPVHLWHSAVEFSPDSKKLAVSHDSGELLLYDLATGNPSQAPRMPGSGHFSSCVSS